MSSLQKAESSLDILRCNKDYDNALRAAKAMKQLVAASNSPSSEANRLTAQGECYAALRGKGDEARRYLVRALQTQKDCVDALIVLAELNIKQGVWPQPAARLRASRSSGVPSRTLAEVQGALALACGDKHTIKGETFGEDESTQSGSIQIQTESGSLFRSNDNADSSIDSPVLSSIASAAAASAALGFSVVDSVELLSRARDLLFTSFSTPSSRLLPGEPHRLFIRVRGMTLLSILSEQGYLPLQSHSLPISDNIQRAKGLKDPSFAVELSPSGKCLLLSIAATDVLWQLVAIQTGNLQPSIPQRLYPKTDGVIAASYCLSNTVRVSLVSDDLEDLVLRTEVSSLLLSNPNFFTSSALDELQQKPTLQPLVDWKQLDTKVKSIVISRIVRLPATLRQFGDHLSALRCASACLDFEGSIFGALQPKDKKFLAESLVSLLVSDEAGIGLQSAVFFKDFPTLTPPSMWCVGGADSMSSQAFIGGGNWHFTKRSPSSTRFIRLSQLLPFVGPIVALTATTRAAINQFLRFRCGYCLFRKVEDDVAFPYGNINQAVSPLSQRGVQRIAKRAICGLLQVITVQPISSDFGSTWRLLAYLQAILSLWSSPSSFSILSTTENEWKGQTVKLSTHGGGACIRSYCISAGIANRQAVALVEAMISSMSTIFSLQVNSANVLSALGTRSELENDLNDISGFVRESMSIPTSPTSTTSVGNPEVFSRKLHLDDSTLLTLAAHASLFHANNPGTALQFAVRAATASIRETQSYGDDESRVVSRVQTWSKDLLSQFQQPSNFESSDLPSSVIDSTITHEMLLSESNSNKSFIDPAEASILLNSAIATSRSEKQICALYILALSLVASARAISGNDSTGGASSGAVIGGGSVCGGFDPGTSSKRMIKSSHRILLKILKITASIPKISLSSSSTAHQEGSSIEELLESLPSNQWHVAYLLGLVSLHQGDATTALCAARKAIALSTAFGDSIATYSTSTSSVTPNVYLHSELEPALALPWALGALASSLIQSDGSNASSARTTSALILGGLKLHPNDCLLRLLEVLAAERLLGEKRDAFDLGEIQSPQSTVLAGGAQEVLTSMRAVAHACDSLAWRFIEACTVQSTPNYDGESAVLTKKPVLSFGSPDALGKPSPPAPYVIKLAVCAQLHVSRLSAALKLFPSAYSALVKADSLVDATSLSFKFSGASSEPPAFYSVGVDPILRADVIHAVGVLHEAAAGYVVPASAFGQDHPVLSQSLSIYGSQLSSSLSGSSDSHVNSPTSSRVANPAAVFSLGGFSHAEAQYAAAIAIAPNHVASLVRLGEISLISAILRSSGKTLDNHSEARTVSSTPVEFSCKAILMRDQGIKTGPELGYIEMVLAKAEGFITRALRVDATCADAWSVFSRIFAAKGISKSSSEAALKAIELRQGINLLPPGMLPPLGNSFLF